MNNGFNLQEIISLINKQIPAFQDRQSDFKIDIEDLSQNSIKPSHWLFISEDSITFDIKRSTGLGWYVDSSINLLEPYAQSSAFDDVEKAMQSVFMTAFHELYGETVQDIHYFGMPHLGSPKSLSASLNRMV
jgi:hypothetical protein